jgi:hypothetical protein
MKILKRVLIGIPVALIALLIVFRITGLDPGERVPGLWLSGPTATEVPADWSFVNDPKAYATVKVQTRTWYLIPHSVTTTVFSHGGQLYLTSSYRPGMVFPRDRAWNRNFMRDPHVRIKIGGKIYDRVLTVVTDPNEKAEILKSKQAKYPEAKMDIPNVHLFRATDG